MTENRRETGGRVLKPSDQAPRTSRDKALEPKPVPYGLTRDIDETEAKTRESDGVEPPLGARRT